jgi:hypothetical protein
VIVRLVGLLHLMVESVSRSTELAAGIEAAPRSSVIMCGGAREYRE